MIKGATTYPLLDPERYDDEFGEGYGFAAVADAQCEGAWIADCWVVDREGAVHPGYAESPVPIRADDLDIANGFPTVMEARERAPFAGWR